MVLLDYFTLLLIRDQLSAQSGSRLFEGSLWACRPVSRGIKTFLGGSHLGKPQTYILSSYFHTNEIEREKKSRSSTKLVFKRTIKAWHMGLRVLDISTSYYGKLWQVWFFWGKRGGTVFWPCRPSMRASINIHWNLKAEHYCMLRYIVHKSQIVSFETLACKWGCCMCKKNTILKIILDR